MEIRIIEKNDIQKCLAIYNHYVLNTKYNCEENAVTLESFEHRVFEVLKAYPFLVAVDGEKVLGFCYLNQYSSRSAYRFCADLSLYVDKNYQCKGIGKALFSKIEQQAKDMGIKNIVSIIISTNYSSVAFHENNGFKLKGELDKIAFKMGEWLSISYYQKCIK